MIKTFLKFLKAFSLTDSIKKFCYKRGINIISYVHEAIKNNRPEMVMSSLFKKLEINNFSKCYVVWRQSPKFGDKDSLNRHLCFYGLPPKKFIAGVRNWGEYQYQSHPISRANNLSQNVFKIYESFREECEASLGLKISI